MAFSLTNVPTTFEAAMNSMFASLIRKRILIFMDDILIYRPLFPVNLSHLWQALDILQQQQLTAKQSKYVFAQ
jgi:hypothetical protein